MGCGSAKLTSNTHIPTSTSNESGLMGGGTLDNLNHTSDISLIPSTSRDILSINNSSYHNQYSTAMGIKGNSKIRVTLSDDGSLLEIETVTIDSIDRFGGSSKSEESLDIQKDITNTLCSCEKCDKQQDKSSPDNQLPNIGQGFLTINEECQFCSRSCTNNGSCNNNNISENSSPTATTTNDNNLLNNDICSCSCKNKNNSNGSSSAAAKKIQCCSLPDIKSHSTNGDVFSSPSITKRKPNSYSFQQTEPRSLENKKASNSFSNCNMNPGGKLLQNNCPVTSNYRSKCKRNEATCNDQVGCAMIKRSISNCYPQDKKYPVEAQWYHENEGTDDILHNKYSAVERSLSYDSGHRGREINPRVADYTCLDYCARKCYNYSSFPHFSNTHQRKKECPEGAISSNRSIGNVRVENDLIVNTLNCDNSTNGTPINMIRGSPSYITDQSDITTSSVSSTPLKQIPSLPNIQVGGNFSNIKTHSKSMSRESSGVSSISSHEASSASPSSARQLILKDKLQSSSSSSSAYSPILSKMKSSKRGFNILKIKALSEDSSSSHVPKRGTPFKCSHSASFDGKTSANNCNTVDNDNVEPLELNIHDVGYVHKDFFNDFGDMYDEDVPETCV